MQKAWLFLLLILLLLLAACVEETTRFTFSVLVEPAPTSATPSTPTTTASPVPATAAPTADPTPTVEVLLTEPAPLYFVARTTLAWMNTRVQPGLSAAKRPVIYDTDLVEVELRDPLIRKDGWSWVHIWLPWVELDAWAALELLECVEFCELVPDDWQAIMG